MTRDLRQYSRNTLVRLIIGGLFFIFIVGDGLIYIFYGSDAALMGGICLMVGLLPLLLIWFALAVLGWIVQYAHRD